MRGGGRRGEAITIFAWGRDCSERDLLPYRESITHNADIDVRHHPLLGRVLLVVHPGVPKTVTKAGDTYMDLDPPRLG